MIIEPERVDVQGDVDLSRVSFTQGIRYASFSEGACGHFIEKYGGIPMVKGETVHIKVGTKEVDFYLPPFNLFVEYHPISRYDWKSPEAARRYGVFFRHLSQSEKRESWAIHKLDMAEWYRRERRLVLNDNGHKDAGLLHLQSGSDLYREVLVPLFRVKISESEFLREWGSYITMLSRGCGKKRV